MPFDKASYGYLTLRYVHDVVTGEFANIGVVLFAPQQRILESQFLPSFDRLDAFFLHTDHVHLLDLTNHLKMRFSELGEELRMTDEIFPVTQITKLAARVMPHDDSSLQWSEMSGGFCEEPGAAPRDVRSAEIGRHHFHDDPEVRAHRGREPACAC